MHKWVQRPFQVARTGVGCCVDGKWKEGGMERGRSTYCVKLDLRPTSSKFKIHPHFQSEPLLGGRWWPRLWGDPRMQQGVRREDPKETGREDPKEMEERRPQRNGERGPQRNGGEKAPKKRGERIPKKWRREDPKEMGREDPKEMGREDPKETRWEDPKEMEERRPQRNGERRPQRNGERRPQRNGELLPRPCTPSLSVDTPGSRSLTEGLGGQHPLRTLWGGLSDEPLSKGLMATYLPHTGGFWADEPRRGWEHWFSPQHQRNESSEKEEGTPARPESAALTLTPTGALNHWFRESFLLPDSAHLCHFYSQVSCLKVSTSLWH